ncbi:MAG: hypothetical protein LBD16_01790 [Oscillospiraceae bacterium]|nr:hypothetical protein [Oscillospiraceae bacterium]
MKRFFTGLAVFFGAVILALGLSSMFLPIQDIIGRLAWLGFLRWIENVRPFELLFVITGGVLFLGGIILSFMLGGKPNETVETRQTSQESLYRADNMDIKARVRDLLRRAWGGPLVALVLIFILYGGIQAGTYIFLKPFQTVYSAVSLPIITFFDTYKDSASSGIIKSLLVPLGLITTGAGFPDFTGIWTALLPALPWILLLVVARLCLFNPLAVSRADYFTQLLFGKKPSPFASFGINANYKKYLGGTLYRVLWLVIHAVSTLVFPIGLYVGGITIINAYPEQFTMISVQLLPALAIVSLALFLGLLYWFVNRCLAYSLVPSLLATQKQLPARRAMRASRYLMRGHKTRLMGLWMSFTYYFVPTIAAGAILIILNSSIGRTFAFTEIFTLSLKRFLYSVILLNQIMLLYVAPISHASFYAFYLEMRKEFKDTHPSLSYIIGAQTPKLLSPESLGLSSFVKKPDYAEDEPALKENEAAEAAPIDEAG